MMTNVNSVPVFIHSLFRSGSTYIFKAFRRGGEGYWCYQEPLHEVAYFCRHEPDGLCAGRDKEMLRELRHPMLEDAYFKELKEVWPAWKDTISAGIIYNDYFAACDEKFNKAYWQSLIDAAPRRPVFQECRTSGRIAAIKGSLGGTHLYLWRNPWDQWWSYKVNPYFDLTSNLVVHARNAPKAAELLAASLGLSAYSGSEEDIAAAFAYYSERPLSSDHSYQLFYLLWCLALHEGLQHADLMLSIDQLSDSAAYRTETLGTLQRLGIAGVDFSDCVSPQAMYSETERAWFVAQEAKVHACLLEGGWRLDDLERLQSVRDQHQPALWKATTLGEGSGSLGDEQGCRARALARRFETTMAEQLHLAHVRQKAVEQELDVARQAVHQTEQTTQGHNELLRQMESELGQTRTDASVLQARLEERLSFADARAAQTEQSLVKAEARATEFSSSLDAVTSELVEAQTVVRMQQAHFEERLASADARAAQAEQRVVKAKERAAELNSSLDAVKSELVEAQTVVRIQQAHFEERLASADARAAQAEQRVVKAEAKAAELNSSLGAVKSELVDAQTAMHIQQARFEERGAEQQSRLAALERQLTDALTDNHYHWLLANERAEELARVSGLYDQVSQALQASEAAQSRLAAERDQKSGEIQYWHQRVLDLHASTSWRLTKPLRGIKRLVNGEVEVKRSTEAPLVAKGLHGRAQVLLEHGIRYVVRRPRLKVLLRKTVALLPGIERRLVEIRTAQIRSDFSQRSKAISSVTAPSGADCAVGYAKEFAPGLKRNVNDILDCIRAELRQQAGGYNAKN